MNNASQPDKRGAAGPQGVDKAPGEESASQNVQFTQQTQKGKEPTEGPVDETDRPIEQELDDLIPQKD